MTMDAINFGVRGDFSPSVSLHNREVRGGGALPELPGGGGACCSTRRLDRRHFFQLAGSAGLLALSPSLSLAAEGDYDAMLLSCIDPRMVTPVYKYMDQRGLTGQYSQFVIAGAAIAVIAPKFEVWRPAFWDNLATTVQLHHIKRLIAIDHRDCGAAEIAYGAASIADPRTETETHRKVLAELRNEVGKRQPGLTIETGLMALDSSIQMLG
jgi:carbonic anhydrase